MTQTNGHQSTPPLTDRPVKPRPEPERKLMVATWDGDTLLDLESATDSELSAECARRGLAIEPAYSVEELRVGEPGRVVPRLAELMRGHGVSEPARDTERPPLSVSTPEQYEGLMGDPPPKNLFDPPLVFSVNAGRSCGAHGGAIDPNCRDCYTSSGPHQAPGEVTRIRRPGATLPSQRLHEIALERTGQSDDGNWTYTMTVGDVTRYLDERLGPAKEKKSLRQAIESRLAPHYLAIGDAANAKVEALIEVLEERLP